MIQPPRSTLAGLGLARFAALAALAAALGLSGCGRKAGLDAPPVAAAGDLQASGQPGPASTQTVAGKPVSPPAEKRKTFLDWLID